MLAATLAATLLLAACAGNGDDDASTASDEPSAAPPATDGAATDASPTTVPAAGRDRLVSDVARITEPWPTDWSEATIDVAELRAGIGRLDPRDAIPPIDDPTFEPLDETATWLDDRSPGALVTVDGESRFYPLAILTWHEIVNDEIAGVPVAVTYCPLCNTAITFDRRAGDRVLRFGVSGLLRNSDLVMWDDATTSLWQQSTGEGIVGELAGTRLEPITTAIVSLADVRQRAPEARSLTRDTGIAREYGLNPYVNYSSQEQPFGSFFPGEVDDRLPALERVVGVTVGGTEAAYPFSRLAAEPVVNDEVGGVPVVVTWSGDTADALDDGRIADSRNVGTGVALVAEIDGQRLTFDAGPDDTMVDAETDTTWSRLGVGLDGPLAGATLDLATHRNDFWFAWAAFFPDARLESGSG